MRLIAPPARTVPEALARLKAVNPSLNAFIGTAPPPRADASRRQAGDGILANVPFAAKDLCFLEGESTTAGSPIYKDFVAPHTATVVERLEAAGAILVGRTTLHELAYGITSNNPHFGAVRNPYDTDRIPGGSSGGSGAAVASGAVPIAIGSDTGGSIRIPASFCGVVGIKPTYGLVSRHGVIPLGFSLDHIGPLAATVRDAALALEAMAGYDAADPHSSRRAAGKYGTKLNPSARGIRLGLPENFFFERLQTDVDSAVRAAVEKLVQGGASTISVRVPDMNDVNTAARIILLAEASSLYEQYLDRPHLFGKDVHALIIQGAALSATSYVNAQRLRTKYQADFFRLFDRIDVLVTPTTPLTAPRIGQDKVEIAGREEDVRLASTRYMRGINLLGLPAISLPCGYDSQGLPIGIQLIGRAFSEQMLFDISAALEELLELNKSV